MRAQTILPSPTRTPIKYSKVTPQVTPSNSIDGYILFLIFIIGILGATYILSWSSANASPFTSKDSLLEQIDG